MYIVYYFFNKIHRAPCHFTRRVIGRSAWTIILDPTLTRFDYFGSTFVMMCEN